MSDDILKQAESLAKGGTSIFNSKRGQYSQGSIATGPSQSIKDHINSTKSPTTEETGEEIYKDAISMTEEGQGFWENTGRLALSLTANASSAVADLLGAAIDVGDWHHYLPDTESKDFKDFMASGQAGIATYSNLALSNISKWIDNTIGDGETEIGNIFTEKAAELRELNQMYNQVNITGTNGQAGGIGGWTEWGLNGAANLIGSIVGNLGGAGAARSLAVKGGSKMLSMMGGAFITTNATGMSIAQGVYDDTFDHVLEQDPAYKKEKELIYENAKREYLSNNPDEGGARYGNAEFYAKEKVDAFKQQYITSNPEAEKQAKQMAIIGADVAIKTNAAGFFFNLVTSRLAMRGVGPASRVFKGKPTKWGEAGDYVGEMMQEVVEEAVIENIVEKRGLAHGKGMEYGMSDAYNDVMSKEGLESAFWAMLGAGGTTASINRYTHKSRLEQAKPAMDAIDKQNAIMKASGGAGLNDLVALSTSSQDIANLVRERSKLESEEKYDEAKLVNDKIVYNQALHAMKTGTSENLMNVYNHLANDEKNSKEVRENAQKAMGDLTKLEEIYNKAQSQGYKNADTVYVNQARDYMLSKHDAELDTAIALKKTEAASAILSGKETGELPSLKVTKTRGMGTPELAGVDGTYEEELEFDIEDLSSAPKTFFQKEKAAIQEQQRIIAESREKMKDPSYQDQGNQVKYQTRIDEAQTKLKEAQEAYDKVKSQDETYSTTHKNFVNAAKQHIQAVRELQRLQDSKENIQQAIHEGRKEYNELTSTKYQKMLGHEEDLMHKMHNNKADIQDAMLNDPHFEKTLDAFLKPYKGLIPDGRLEGIKSSYMQSQKALAKAKKDADKKVAEDIAKDIKPASETESVLDENSAEAQALTEMFETQNQTPPTSTQQQLDTQQPATGDPFGAVPPSTLGENDIDTMMASSNLMSTLGSIDDSSASLFGNVIAPTDELMSEASKQMSEDVQETPEGLESLDSDELANLMSDPLEVKEGLSPQQVQAIQDGIAHYKEVLDSNLEREATFEDFVRDFIRTQGRDKADKYFNILVKGWEMNQFPAAKYKDVYNNLFKTTKEIGASLLDVFQDAVHEVTTVEESEEVHEKLNEKPLAEKREENKPTHITADNEPVVENMIHEGFTTNNTSPKLNFKSRSSTKKVDEAGVVTYEYDDEGLNQITELTGVHKLLDYDKFLPGSELQARIPSEEQRNNTTITIYKPDGNVKTTMKFGEWVSRNNIEEGSQEWLDHVPMMFYDAAGDSVAFVHDVSWYNPMKFREVNQGDTALAKKQTREIRQAVYNGGKDGATMVITSKTSGTYEGAKIPKDKPRISLREGDPQTKVATFNNKTGKLEIDGKPFDGELENKREVPFTTDRGKKVYNYQVRRTGTRVEDGKTIPLYTAFHVTQPKLEAQSIDNILNAIKLYVHTFNTALTPDSKANIDNVKTQIFEATGYNVGNVQDLDLFIKRYMIGGTPSDTSNATAIAKSMSRQLANGKPWMVTQSGVIYFGIAGQNLLPEKQYGFINPHMLKTQKGLETFKKSFPGLMNILKTKILPQVNQNISTEGLKNNKVMIDIAFDSNTKQFSASTAAETYEDHLLDGLQTDLRSFNIGTAQEPKHVTRIQPVINYQLKGAKPNVVPEITEKNINESNEVVQEAEKVVQEAPVTETVVKELTPQEEVINEAIEENVQSLEEELESKKAELESEDSQFKAAVLETEISILEDKVKKEKERTKEPVVKVEKKELPRFTPEQIAEAKKQAMEDTAWISDDDFNVMYDPVEITDETVKEMVKDMLKIPGLASHHQYQLVDFVFNQLAAGINFDKASKVDKKVIMAEITTQLESILSKVKTDYITRKEILATASEDVEAQRLIDKYDSALAYINNILKNKDVIAKDGLNKVYKYTGIKETKEDESEIEDNNGRVQIYSKTFLEDSGKESASYRIKRFLSGIQDVDENGNPISGFLGTPSYIGFDDMFNTLQAILADSSPDFEHMIDVLERNAQALPFLTSVVKKLKEADNQVQNEFTSLMARNTMNMEFVMYSFNKNTGSYTLQIYNSNSTSIVRTIRKKWYNNLTKSGGSGLIKVVNGDYHINKDKAQELLDEFESFTDKPLVMKSSSQTDVFVLTKNMKEPHTTLGNDERSNRIKKEFANKDKALLIKNGVKYQVSVRGDRLSVTPYKMSPVAKLMAGQLDNDGIKVVQDWLSAFGIELSTGTVAELVQKGMYHAGTEIAFKDMFDRSSSANNSSLFGMLADFLNQHTDEDSEFNNEVNNPLTQGVIKTLAKLESRYNKTVTPNAFRDGGKNIQGYTVSKFITDRASKLKGEDDTVREQLKTLSYSKHSMWLAMMEDPKFREKFGVTHLGINAIKEFGKRLYRDNGVTTLADADHELTKLGCFMDMKQGTVDQDYSGFKMRIARMFCPTMSDKTTMTLLKTGVLDLQEMHFGFEKTKGGTTTKIVVKEPLLNMMYKQLLKPELERMHKYHSKGRPTNIKSYDKGARLFLTLPQANNLTVEDINGNKIKLIDAIATDPEKFSVAWIEENVGPQIKVMMQKYVEALVANKIKVWNENGYLSLDARSNITAFKFFDHKYMAKWDSIPDVGHKVNLTALDFVINSLISNSNSFMTMAGDPALYYKTNRSTASTDYVQITKDTFGNVSKRLANQIAPGNKLADSDNNQYLQIFMKDIEGHTSNLPFLTNILDNKEFDQETWDKILAMPEDSVDQQKAKMSAKRAFAKQYPATEDYFFIEGADGQEYTTWKEHLYVLEKLGKTSDAVLDVTPADIRRAREIFSAGTPMDQLSDFDKSIVKMVMQPMKPVYTGQIYDAEQDVMRTVYIKTSSFPLIPQITKGLQIDKLRNAMEDLENRNTPVDENGVKADRPTKTVRASFMSGVKVGGLDNSVKIFSDYTGDMEGLNADSLQDSALTLDRSNFRIQQDVPFKAGKKKADLVTLGTQTTKIVMGNGVTEMDGFKYKGETLTGKELQKRYINTFDRLLKHKRDQLYDELGIDKVTGEPKDIRKSAKKIQKILREEAESRGYSKQVIESLTMTEIKDSEGNLTGMTFNLPLWMSAESNRFESLLNAIVTNRIAKIKMPGNSYVAGSQEGFKQVNALDNFAGDKSKIVFTSKWEGELKAAEFNEDGSLKKTQVLLPSRFRDNDGNLIDMFAMKDGEHLYVEQNEKGAWRLKEQMFEDDLLSNISFRIPTSAHLSMVDVEIVGFLPYEVGDLIIVPRNLTTQLGLDFDVDKQTNYQYWHAQNDDGSFYTLDGNVEEMDMHLQNARDLLNDLKDYEDSFLEEIEELEEKFQEKIDDYEEIGFVAPAHLLKTLIANKKKELKDFRKEDIAEQVFAVKQLEEHYMRLLQNDIIRATSSVLSNPGMQQKINGVLSIAYAKEQAERIDSMISDKDNADGGASADYFTPLSDEYQKANMVLGASGQIGIGAYSTDVVFHSLVQQNDADLNLTETVMVGGFPVKQDKSFRFGNLVSNGKLGNMNTILADKTYYYVSKLKDLASSQEVNNLIDLLTHEDETNRALGIELMEGQAKINPIYQDILDSHKENQRPIATVLMERQNIATDNAKETVMHRVNLGPETLDVDKVLVLLGFDKGEDGNSIPFLFMTQPIVRDFVKMIGNASANTAEFSANKEQDVINKLKEKYGFLADLTPGQKQQADKMMTNRMLESQLKATKPDGQFQMAVLMKFLELKAYGKHLRKVQGTLNVDSKGLGKSTFDTIDKFNKLEQLPDNEFISNAKTLIGEYVLDANLTQEERADYLNRGYVKAKDYLIKPTTVAGSFSVNTIITADNLWSKYFPYSSPVMDNIFNEITEIMGTKDGKMIETKQHIVQEMKKYVNSSDMNLYTLSPQQERARLFIDSDTNESLSTYLNGLMSSISGEHQKAVNALIKKNKLIGRFEFDMNKNGNISTIKFNNAVGENFDEDQLYNSLLSLMDNPVPLPSYNGKPYNTRLLAQDLINYAVLEGGVQKAIQFSKFIPISFLNQSGYSANARSIDFENDNGSLFGVHFNKPKGMNHLVSDFTMQFAQHNPEKMPKVTKNDLVGAVYDGDSKKLSDLQVFAIELMEGEVPSTFVSIYDSSIPKGSKKFHTFYFNGEHYMKIPVKGTFGMDEYNAQSGMDIEGSIVSPTVPKKAVTVQKTVVQPKKEDGNVNIPHEVDKGNIQTTINSIAKANYPGLSDMAKALSPYVDGSTKLLSSDLQGRGYGVYSPNQNAIVMDSYNLSQRSAEDTARTILHEYVHSITVSELKKYITFKKGPDGKDTKEIDYVNDGAPAYVDNLVRMYNKINKHFGTELNEVYRKVSAREQLTPRERRVVYGGTDIFEFLTLMTTSPEFQTEMAKIKYDKNTTILDKFKQVMKQVLEGAGIVFESDTIAAQAINETFKLLEGAKQEKSNTFEITAKDSNESLKNEVDKTLEIFGGEEGQVVMVGNQKMLVKRIDAYDELVYREDGEKVSGSETINKAVIKYHHRPGGDGSKRRVDKGEHQFYVLDGPYEDFQDNPRDSFRIINLKTGSQVLEADSGLNEYTSQLREKVIGEFFGKMGYAEGTQQFEEQIMVDGHLYTIEDHGIFHIVKDESGQEVDGDYDEEGSTFAKVMNALSGESKPTPNPNDPFGSQGLPSDDDIAGMLDPSEVNEVEELINEFENTCK